MSPCTPHSPQTPSACPLYPARAPRTHAPFAPPTHPQALRPAREPCASQAHEAYAPPAPWASRTHAPSPCAPASPAPFAPPASPSSPCPPHAPLSQFAAGLHGFGTLHPTRRAVSSRIARFWHLAPGQKSDFGPDCTVLGLLASINSTKTVHFGRKLPICLIRKSQNRAIRPQTSKRGRRREKGARGRKGTEGWEKRTPKGANTREREGGHRGR